MIVPVLISRMSTLSGISTTLTANSILQAKGPGGTVTLTADSLSAVHVAVSDFTQTVAVPVSSAALSAVVACANIDTTTNSVKVIEYEHNEIHGGSMFTVDWYPGDVSAAASANLFIVTPNTTKWAHIVPEVSTENESTFYIYEGASYAASGTQIVPINKNRNSATASTCFVNHTPSTPSISGATLIRTIHWGSSKAYGGYDRNALEFILKQNTTYLFQVVNNSAGAAWTHLMLIWYEHTNKSFY